MMENTLVYHGAHAPIEELLDHAIKNPVRLDARDVEVVEAARAVEGEVWSPQLPAYRAWAAEGEAGDVAGGAGREGDLYSAGALWMGEFDELLAQAAERDAADAQETPRARMEEGLRGAVGVRQVPGGYALTAFDLRRFAAAVGQSDDLAVLLPAYVDGIPVVRVASSAFADGCEPPAVVDCSAALARVDSRSWDDAVWRCPVEAPAYRALRKRGVRLAGPAAVELEGCWYDFDAEGAVLVAGPPKPISVSRRFAEQAAVRAVAVRGKDEVADDADVCALSPAAAAAEAATEFAASGEAGSTVGYVSASASDVLALPRQVEGRPLVRIGVRALPFAPASVVVPETVRIIERDNACRGTKRLILPEGLVSIGAHCFWSRKLEGPVLIPASVRSVGEGSFEYAVCRLSHVGAIVHVSADQLLTCFLTDASDGVPFDFGRYDELLRSGKNLPDRLGALLHRLAVPYRLADDMRSVLVSHLRGYGREAQERIAREGDRNMVEALVKAGFIDDASFDRQIELLRACNRTDCVAYLMEHHRAQAKPTSAKERFAL